MRTNKYYVNFLVKGPIPHYNMVSFAITDIEDSTDSKALTAQIMTKAVEEVNQQFQQNYKMDDCSFICISLLDSFEQK